MIVSPGRGYIFVHIPKTGGTALALRLESRAMKDDILIGDTPKARARRHRLAGIGATGRLWKHSRIADLAGWIDGTALETFFVFTLVRNPWDRLVSYYHWARVQTFDHPAVHLARTLDFAAFVAHPVIRDSLRSHQAAHYTTDAQGCDRAALCARLEHLGEDLAPLAERLAFDPLPPARVNASGRDRDWRPYYTDATATMVAADSRSDILRFGYRFDP